MALSHPVQKPDEMVQLVDIDGNDLGGAPRRRVRQDNLLHRASAVIIFNSQGHILVQKRVSFKETFPSHFDCCPGGICGTSESVAENAAKELEEEMGIHGVKLKFCFEYLHKSEGLQYWGSLFSCTWDGLLRLQPEEVESAQFLTLQELRSLLDTGPVCPDSTQAMRQYMKWDQPTSASCQEHGHLVSH